MPRDDGQEIPVAEQIEPADTEQRGEQPKALSPRIEQIRQLGEILRTQTRETARLLHNILSPVDEKTTEQASEKKAAIDLDTLIKLAAELDPAKLSPGEFLEKSKQIMRLLKEIRQSLNTELLSIAVFDPL